MASLALGLVASSFFAAGSAAATAAAIIGAAIGSQIDSLIIGSLQDPAEAPKLDLSQFSGVDEGKPTPWLQGTMRVPGQVIWMSEIREKEDGGGKGEADEVDYFVDVAIGWCKTECGANPVRKIFADGQIIWNIEESIVEVSDDRFTATAVDMKAGINGLVTAGQFANDLLYRITKEQPANIEEVDRRVLFTHTPVSGEGTQNIFQQFSSGADVTVTGGANTGTFEVLGITCNAGGVPGVSTMLVRVCSRHNLLDWISLGSQGAASYQGATCNSGTTDATMGELLTFTQTVPDKNEGIATAKVNHHLGTQDQDVDDIIEDAEGVGNVPAYRGLCYTVIRKLKITKWGARLPNFEAIIRQSPDPSIATVMSNALTRGIIDGESLTESDFDVSEVSSTSIDGIMAIGPTRARQVFTQMAFLKRLDAQDAGDKIRFFIRSSDLPTVSVDDDDIQARIAGDNTPLDVQFEVESQGLIPNAVSASFQNETDDYRTANRGFVRQGGATNNVQNVELLMSETPQLVTKACKEKLVGLMGARTLATFSLPMKYETVLAGDKLSVKDADGVAQEVRVENVAQSRLGLVQVEGRVEDAHSIEQSVDDSEDITACLELEIFPSAVYPWAVELPPLEDDALFKAKIWLGAYVMGDETFPLTKMFESTNGSNFSGTGKFKAGIGAGYLINVPDPDVPYEFWDRKSTITIQFYSDDLEFETIDRDTALLGENILWMAGELVLFTTATKVGWGQWQFTELIRGWRGTEAFMDIHETLEEVVALSESIDSIKIKTVGLKAINTTRLYKAVPSGSPIADPVERGLFVQGDSIRAFSPYAVRHWRDGSDGLHIQFRRRTRQPFRALSGVTPKLLENNEVYYVDFVFTGLSAPTGTVILDSSDIDATGLVSASFDSSELDTLFLGSAPSTFDVVISQKSDDLNRGRRTRFTVKAP